MKNAIATALTLLSLSLSLFACSNRNGDDTGNNKDYAKNSLTRDSNGIITSNADSTMRTDSLNR